MTTFKGGGLKPDLQAPSTIKPTLRRRLWLFDLDNTLHDASAKIFPEIGRAMASYMVEHLKLSPKEAIALRQAYWARYGTTLTGLMRHHAVDPEHFLEKTHTFDALSQWVVPVPFLRSALSRLSGDKVLFSNAPAAYVRALVSFLKIGRYFKACYAIEDLAYRPKPMRASFRHVLAKERQHPRDCIMVDDTLDNLKSAKQLGMKTVWITQDWRAAAAVDVKVKTILDLLNHHARL